MQSPGLSKEQGLTFILNFILKFLFFAFSDYIIFLRNNYTVFLLNIIYTCSYFHTPVPSIHHPSFYSLIFIPTSLKIFKVLTYLTRTLVPYLYTVIGGYK
jgi:hypothetical protein